MPSGLLPGRWDFNPRSGFLTRRGLCRLWEGAVASGAPSGQANLTDDNQHLAHWMRELHQQCEDIKDVATSSLLEIYLDEAERRTWFLYEATRPVD